MNPMQWVLAAASTTRGKLQSVILPKGKSTNPGRGWGVTSNPAAPNTLKAAPAYRDHLTDLFTNRQSGDARTLITNLMVNDPDVSAATNAFLTTANTEMVAIVRDINGAIDRTGQKTLNQIMTSLFTRYDYTTGFESRQSLGSLCESLRYMLLARGMLAVEMIITKDGVFDEIRQINPDTLLWYEKVNGKPTPVQRVSGVAGDIDLNWPTFFTSYFRQDPTSLYPASPFTSAINTIAARQQVINDLYRIMQVTGYPRMQVEVLEEVLLKNAPPIIKADADKQQTYVANQLSSITATLASLRPDQPFVHTDSINPKVLNEKTPGMTLNIDPIIRTLNAQNQAGLRAVATILGRGESGVNTASVEARIFSMTAQELNEPIADLLSRIFTMALRMTGSQSQVTVRFKGVELRPDLELEPQLTMKAARLKEDLSLGIIDDDEYHLEMYGRIRPDNSPVLSGTNFRGVSKIDTSNISPNSDPLGRSLTPPGSKAAKSNTVK